MTVAALVALCALLAREPVQAPAVEGDPAFAAPGALRQLALARPGWIELRTLGQGAAGGPIEVAVVGDTSAEGALVPRARRPGVLVASAGERAHSELGELVVAALAGVLQRGDADPAIARLLRERVLYVLPDLEVGADDVRFARDFPCGWLPAPLRAGSGERPLTTPSARALAEFLVARPNLNALHLVEGGEGSSPPVAAQPLALCATPAGVAPIEAWDGPAEGGPLAFARDRLALYTLRGGAPLVAEARAAAVEVLALQMLALLRALPSLELGVPSVEALGGGLWLVDAPLDVRGVLAVGARGAPAEVRSLFVALSGVEVVAVAARFDGESAARTLRVGPRGEVRLGDVPPGARVELRVLAAGDGATPLRIEARAARAGATALVVGLAGLGG